MTATDERVRDLITQQASDWFVANRAPLSDKEREAFAAWLQTSPVHVQEYLGVAAVARDLPAACNAPQFAIEALVASVRSEATDSVRPLWSRLSAPPSFHWQRAAVFVAALGVVAAVGFSALWHAQWIARSAAPAPVVALHFASRHGEQHTYRLADNSLLRLNTDSEVIVRFSERERSVILAAGEAEFEVTHDVSRPFRVAAGVAEVVDVGTQFDVRLLGASTQVTVVEGQVTVGPLARTNRVPSSDRDGAVVELGAGQQISVSEQVWPAAPMTVDTERTTAWMHRQIMFEHEPLERVATEFNRYGSKPIEIATPALRKLEISGVFATDDADAFIAFLRSLKGVHVDISAARIRVSQD